ncbi:CHASE2 domain-containing protein [Candidatus Poribacteria bacterium]|nr:CHASE2 domain-containing protein [Candidatus Poribacteria bacterium]
MLSKLARSQKVYLLIGIVSLLPFIVVGFLRDLGTFEFIELKTLDSRLRWTAPPVPPISSQVALVTIDAKSEEVLGPMPWRSDLYAALIRTLQQVDPKAIGLVASFNREWPDAQRIPGKKLFVIRPYPKPKTVDRHVLPKVTDWRTLPDSLAQAQGWGFSYFPLSDSDGICRSAQLVVEDRATGTYRYSLVMSILYQTYGVFPTAVKVREGFWIGKHLEFNSPAGEVVRIPIDSRGRLFIRFAGDEGVFQPVSFVDALSMSDNETDRFRHEFSNKCMLIGITTEGVNKRATPLGELSALALRANLLNGLLNQDFVWQFSRGGNRLYIVCLAILSAVATILIYRSGHSYRSMLLFGSGLILCHLLFVGGMFVLFDLWIEVTGSSLALLLSSGISSLLLAHLRLRHLLGQLQTTQDQLVRSEKEAVFGVMSARVRHELRNALNLIRAPAEMIRVNFQKQDPLKLREQPKEIVSEMDQIIGWVTKLDEMIEDEFSFFQDSHMNFQQQALEPLLKSAVEMVQPVIDENQIEVRMNLPPTIPPLRLDDDKMRIVFTNLIKNACQAMPSGGTLEIVVEVSILQQDRVTVIVRDTGGGIPADELYRIFEPFYTTKPRGLGLGLVNVKNIVEAHGGTVRVESEVGIGTTFFVRL